MYMEKWALSRTSTKEIKLAGMTSFIKNLFYFSNYVCMGDYVGE